MAIQDVFMVMQNQSGTQRGIPGGAQNAIFLTQNRWSWFWGTNGILVFGNSGSDTRFMGQVVTVNGAARVNILPLPRSIVYMTMDPGVSNLFSPCPNWNGDVFEILVLAKQADGAVRAQVEGYLAWANGLTATTPLGIHPGHPFAAFPPRIS
jgi:hypothetical protein